MADYYINASTGNDSNTGLDPTTNAWATVQKLLDTCVAGDTCGIVTGTVYSISAVIDADTNAGTGTTPIKVYACDSSGNEHTDDTRAIIRASSSIASIILYTSSSQYVYWQNVEFDGNSNVTGDIIDHTGIGAGTGCHYANCVVHDGSGAGWNFRGSWLSFIDCEVYGCATGIKAAAAIQSRGEDFFIKNCKIHDNTGNAIENVADHSVFIDGNLIYDNGGIGISISGGAGGDGTNLSITHNVIFGNDGDGIDISAARPKNTMIANNSMMSNGGYGMDVSSAIALDAPFIDYNHFYNNTSGHCSAVSDVNINDGTVGHNNVTGDPSYTSTTDGSEDFTPQSGSNLIQAGLNNSNIGAIAHADGGGGGNPVLPSSLHPIEGGVAT